MPSRLATLLSPVSQASDLTGSFRLYKKTVLESVIPQVRVLGEGAWEGSYVILKRVPE